MMFKKLTEDWQRLGACVSVGVALVIAAIGAENHFAKADTVKEILKIQQAQQQQVYNMQASQNYSNFQLRLDNLIAPYVTYDKKGNAFIDYSRMPRETVQSVKWLQKEIAKLEVQMGIRK